MNGSRKFSFACLLTALISVGTVTAQSNGSASPIESGVAAPVSKRLKMPFKVGEVITYEGKLSKSIIRGISVADLVFKLSASPSSDDYVINAEARSKGTLLKLFRFSFLQQIDSTVDRDQFVTEKTIKVDVQKERIRNSEALFDYSERRVTYVETDPNTPLNPPRIIASEIAGDTHDIVSAIYSLRMRPLAVGGSFVISVSDSGLVYDVPVRVTGRERIKTEIGNVWCFVVEPNLFGDGRMIEREGSMQIWITDDARRLPVRGIVDASFGKLQINIKSVTEVK
ncbi:hypothetical protein BH24ACI3_BH24ACI3_05730 [soil metagenome]